MKRKRKMASTGHGTGVTQGTSLRSQLERETMRKAIKIAKRRAKKNENIRRGLEVLGRG
jgi:hypothetical protein